MNKNRNILGLSIVVIFMLILLAGCSDKNNIENNNNENSIETPETTNPNESKTDNNQENTTYNLSGTFFGKHTQDSESSQIDITDTSITWSSPGAELKGTFTIEENKIKATWSDGTTSTITIVSDNQLKATEPFSSSGELVIFNKK